jgi:hypothetical protein
MAAEYRGIFRASLARPIDGYPSSPRVAEGAGSGERGAGDRGRAARFAWI